MQMDKLTSKSKEALYNAQRDAEKLGHSELDTLHLAKALLGQDEGVVRPLLQAANICTKSSNTNPLFHIHSTSFSPGRQKNIGN